MGRAGSLGGDPHHAKAAHEGRYNDAQPLLLTLQEGEKKQRDTVIKYNKINQKSINKEK